MKGICTVSFHQSFPFGKESWSWHLKGGNNQIICQGHGFATKTNAKRSVKAVIRAFNSPHLTIRK